MFNAMNIPRKMGLSFVVICASAALVMSIFFANLMMIRSSTDSNNISQSIYAKALALDTALLRQNSQFRGYLVTGDASYLKSYDEGREDYDKTSAELEKLVTTARHRELVLESRKATLEWRKNWGDRLIEVVRAGNRDDAQAQVRSAGKAVLVSAAVLPLREIRDDMVKAGKLNADRQETAITIGLVTLVVGAIVLIGVAVTLAASLSKAIAQPITALTRIMADLAAGRNNVHVPEVERGDELGDMARAIVVFRDAAIAKASADQAQAVVVKELEQGLEALAKGDLTYAITEPFEGVYDRLRMTFNETVDGLERILAQVSGSAQMVYTGSTEIRTASDDQARRTEQQAASLEEANAALGSVTSMVAETASGATEVRRAVDQAHSEAVDGGSVVRNAVSAMDAIEKSSQEIGQIINVIDGIAFQTNLLALNAGVEAARAGDSGKGFAVVANEVRGLALRSADAARDIKALITTSSEQVSQGVELVAQTGKMLDRILDKIAHINGLIAEIANSTEQQALNLQQVSSTVNGMDKMTQQNAAMVEQSTAAARSLVGEADELANMVARFTLRHATAKAQYAPSKPASQPRAVESPLPMPSLRGKVSGNLAMKADDWSEF